MDLKSLQKNIHDLAMRVRKGEWSCYPELQELRKKHRELTGVPEAEQPAPKPPKAEKPAEVEDAAPKEKRKKSRKDEE